MITGKPIPLGGSPGRDEATGRGAYYCIKELEAQRGWHPEEMRVAVQGFGNAGQAVARLLHRTAIASWRSATREGASTRPTGSTCPA